MAAHRPTRWLLGSLMAVAVLLLGLAGVAIALSAQQAEHPPLDTLVVSSRAVPSGFAPYGAATGPLDHAHLLRAGLSEDLADLSTGYGRGWTDDSTGQGVAVEAMDLGRSARVERFLDQLRTQRPPHTTALGAMAGVEGSQGVRLDDAPTGVSDTLTYFGRGSVLIRVEYAGPETAGSTVDDRLTRAEADLIGDRYNGGAPAALDVGEATGRLAGVVLGYLLLVEGVALLRDPLRGGGGGPPWPPSWWGPGWVRDVDTPARSLHGRALAVFAVQLTGLVLVGTAFFPQDAASRLVLVGAGLVIWMGPSALRRDHTRRRGRGLPWDLAAAVALVGAVGCIALAALSTVGSSQGAYSVAAGFLLAAAAVARRWGRRVSARTAHQLAERDGRPVVLLLRCFGDDRSRLRSATLGRRSLVEKLAPGRFDRFEEVVVRHLSTHGPVVAINPPGTRLPPIGAARASLDDDQWQAQVDQWLAQAALVVVIAPAGEVTPGLLWELRRVIVQDRWRQVLVVFPPVRAFEARRRWSLLAQAPLEEPWPFRTPLPADPAHVLALAWRGNGWAAARAGSRTEWTYAAALAELAGEAPTRLTPA